MPDWTVLQGRRVLLAVFGGLREATVAEVSPGGRVRLTFAEDARGRWYEPHEQEVVEVLPAATNEAPTLMRSR